jgi:DNA-directed RNA polymerase specialized sigma24 family protein
MQTAYLNAYLHLADFRKKSSFDTWLTRIAINESLLFVKKRKVQQQALIDKPGITYHHETPGLMNNEFENGTRKIHCRSPREIPAGVCDAGEEISTSETMEVLNLSESNVKVRLNRAKEMLRHDLFRHYKSSQLYDFHLSRCDRVVNFVMNQIIQSPQAY